MIGLSLSLCVKDVLDGYVTTDDIERIISGTCAGSPAVLEAVLDYYAKKYWSKAPAEGVRIAKELFRAGKVHQPRLKDPDYHPAAAGGFHWMKSEDETVWYGSFGQVVH
jgi:hypothetical protein